jgi:hypothetical protein
MRKLLKYAKTFLGEGLRLGELDWASVLAL